MTFAFYIQRIAKLPSLVLGKLVKPTIRRNHDPRDFPSGWSEEETKFPALSISKKTGLFNQWYLVFWRNNIIP